MIRFRYMIVLAMIGVAAMELPLEAQGGAETARSRAESFLRRLDEGAFGAAAAMVGPQMKAAGVTEQMLRASWPQLSGGQKIGALRVQAQTSAQGFQVIDFAVQFGAREQGLRISVDAAQQIEGLRLVEVTTSYAAPAYTRADAFEEVALTVGTAEWPLGATLTLPRGVARAPVVVLVHGSGPHDRDETIGSSKPFKDVAWGLASQGVAVLRYEKRTWKHGARIRPDSAFTVDDEVIEDALAVLAQMRAHERIDPARVHLLGHSLGGMLGPEIAARDGKLAGLILLAGSPRRLTELAIEQLDYLKRLPENAADAAQVPLSEMRAMMERLERRELAAAEPAGGAPAAYFYDLAARNPLAFLGRVRAPILVLQGGRDYQVTEVDFELWKQALAGRSDARFQLYANLNHLFAAGQGRATPAEYVGAATHVDGRVIADIAAFVQGR